LVWRATSLKKLRLANVQTRATVSNLERLKLRALPQALL
jgi:hypothetical protein